MTLMLVNVAGKTPEQLNALAFEMMCRAHPHETYAAYPDRFLAFVKIEAPDLTKEDVERILAETEDMHPEVQS